MPIDLGALAGGFTENLGEHLLEYGVGVAVSEALRPEAVRLGQASWSAQPTRAVDPGTAAAIVAEDVEAHEWGANEAVQSGIDGPRFDAMVGEVLNAPGVGELFEAFRRGLIDQAMFVHGLRKAKLETMWDAPLIALKDVLLSVDQLATARQQGFIDQQRQYAESALQGVDAERAELMYEIAGLPPGIVEAMQLANRGIIDQATFAQIVREGHTKTKYTDVLYQLRRHLLTPSEYGDAALRGWITTDEAKQGGGLSGFEPDDMDLLIKLKGRPLIVHQVQTGTARGGVYNGPTGHIPEAFIRSLEQGSIRPEWYNLAYANRYTLPSAFFMRTLLQQGAITEADFAEWGKQEGWAPDMADKIAAAVAGGAGAKGDPHVTKAETTAWTTAQRTYIAEETTAADVAPIFDLLAIPPDSQTQVLKVWDEVRALTRKQLTPAQVKKAIGQPGKDEAWALQQLLDRGYSRDDAQTFLAE